MYISDDHRPLVGYDNVFNVPLSLIESAEVYVSPFDSETFEAVRDDYLISMQRNNPLSRHYIPPKKKSAESWTTKQEMAEELRKMKVKAEIDEAYQGINFDYDHEAYDYYRDDLHRAGVCDPDDECKLCGEGHPQGEELDDSDERLCDNHDCFDEEEKHLCRWAVFDAEAGSFSDGTGCISQGSFPGMTCEYCGFDPHDLVYYQCKQNDEDLTWDEWQQELEFYFYEGSHGENCQGLIDEMEAKEADYTIDMINSHGIKWSGEIKEKKEAETFEASADDYGDLEYIILELLTDAQLEEEYGEVMDDYGIGRDDLPQKLEDEYRTSEEAEYLRGKYLQEEEAETFEATDWNCPHSSFDILGSWDQYSVLYAQCNDCGRYGSLYTRGPVWDTKGHPTTKKTYNLLKNTPHSPEFWFRSGFRPSGAYESETFEAYNPEQPRDESGRWISDKDEEVPTFTIGDEEWRILPAYGSKITLRDLSEAVMETTHNHLDFDTAHQLVNKMLSEHPRGDSQESRQALLLTLEETRMQLEYADEIGWDMDIEIMAGLLRSRGIQPPPELEEAVINRLTFEDEWAAEAITTRFCPICDETGWMVQQHSDSVDWSCSACGHQWHDWRAESIGYDKPLGESLNWTPYEYGDSKNKPNKPTPAKDFDIGDTFGRNVLLMSEDEDPEPELKKYMVGVPVLHSYAVGPVEAYNEEEAEDEVRNNWRYWRSTIDNNGDWGGPIWRYRGITIDEPEAYETFESNNYQCISCGLSFAQEDTRDIDGDIVCDDCIYNIYGMDA